MNKLATIAPILIAVIAAAALVAVLGGGSADPAADAGLPAVRAPVTVTEWPIYRGDPALHGVSKARLPQTPVLKWTFDTGAPIKSSPVIGHGMAYIGSDIGKAFAIDLKTGKQVWSFTTVAEDMIEAPPTLAGDALLVGGNDGILYCLDAKTGALRWKFETADKIAGAANVVKHASDDRTLALIGSHDTLLYAVDLKTGEMVWEYETTDPINATPAVDGDRVIFGGCDGSLHALSTVTGEELISVEIGSILAAAAALDWPYAFAGHFGNEFVCADLEAGELVWRYFDRNFQYASSPALTKDVVIFGGRDKRVHCLNRVDGAVVWTFNTRGRVDSSPLIVSDKVVIGSGDARLYILNLADGSEHWSYEVGDGISGGPAVIDGLIVVGAEDGVVYAFGESGQ